MGVDKQCAWEGIEAGCSKRRRGGEPESWLCKLADPAAGCCHGSLEMEGSGNGRQPSHRRCARRGGPLAPPAMPHS